MRWLALALVVLVVGGAPTRAAACSCGLFDQPTVETCRGSKRAFAGVVAGYAWPSALTRLMQRRSYNAVGVELVVDRVWSGDVPGRVFTTTGMGGGDCGIDPPPGTRFVVCDDDAGAAAPEYHLCGHPAFDAPELEAALGPSHDPSTGSSWQACAVAAVLALALSARLQRRRRERSSP